MSVPYVAPISTREPISASGPVPESHWRGIWLDANPGKTLADYEAAMERDRKRAALARAEADQAEVVRLMVLFRERIPALAGLTDEQVQAVVEGATEILGDDWDDY